MIRTHRRTLLKQLGFGIAGLTLPQLKTLAAPAGDYFEPFKVGGPVRLSSNENAYGPSPAAKKAMMDVLDRSNRYGWDLTGSLLDAIAGKEQLASENILLGAGSTELLDLVARLAARRSGSFVIADPGYDYWTDAAVKQGLSKITVPLTTDKRTNLPAMLAAIRPDTRLVYICNPNNPTGTTCDSHELAAFVKEAAKKTLVLVDEAYIDFSGKPSLASLVKDQENLVIAKTFSKIYGLAGARIGYALAHRKTMDAMAQLQSWNNGSVSLASAAAAIAALGDHTFTKESFRKNQEVKKYTQAQLERLNLRCIESDANFLYFSLDGYRRDYFQQLKDNQVAGTRIYEEKGKWTRITIGTMDEMQRFIAAIG